MTRHVPPPLQAKFEAALRPSDINEHLELLRELSSRCEHVTEFGLRGANGSTVALLCGQPETFISYDINPWAVVSNAVAELVACAGRTSFQPRVGDTLKITIEPTDLLFVDTLHTAKQLWAELQRHADPVANTVRKYLVFHDTATFGMHGEDGSTPGLRAVLRHFQKNHAFPLWGLKYDLSNCNGLVVLEHVSVEKTPGVWPDPGKERIT
jgi:hypothetical protein